MDMKEKKQIQQSARNREWKNVVKQGVKDIEIFSCSAVLAFLSGAFVHDSIHNRQLKSYALEMALIQVGEKEQIELIPQYNKKREIMMRFSDGSTGILRIHNGEMVINAPSNLNPANAKIDTDKLLYSLKENLTIPEGRVWDYTITRNSNDSIKVRL